MIKIKQPLILLFIAFLFLIIGLAVYDIVQNNEPDLSTEWTVIWVGILVAFFLLKRLVS